MTTTAEHRQEPSLDEAIFENFPGAALVFRLGDLRIEKVNRQFCEMYGYTAEEATALAVQALRPEDQLDHFRDGIARLKRTGRLHVPAARHRKKNGALIWVEVNANALGDPSSGRAVATIHNITERIKTDEDILLVNERFEQVAKATREVIYDWDLETNAIYWAESLSSQFGHHTDANRFRLRDWMENVHPVDRNRFMEEIEEIVSGAGQGSIYTREYRFKRSDGTYAHVLDKSVVIRSSSGKCKRVVGAIEDISDQKETELRNQVFHDLILEFGLPLPLEKRFAVLVERLQEFVGAGSMQAWLVDKGSELLKRVAQHGFGPEAEFFSNCLEGLTEIAIPEFPGVEQLEGQTIIQSMDLSSRESSPLLKTAYNSGFRSMRLFPVRYGFELLGVLAVYSVRPEGPLPGKESILNQICDFLGPEVLRIRHEQQLETFFNISPQVLCIAGLDGHFKKVNPSLVRILGYSEEELKTRPFVEFVHPEDRKQTKERFISLRKGNSITYFENRFLTKSGRTRWLAWTARGVPEDDVAYAVAMDITGKKHLEDLLQQTSELARIGSWEIDFKQRRNYWSPVSCGIFELEKAASPGIEEVLGFVADEASRKRIAGLVAEARKNGTPFEAEARIISRYGNVKWVRINGNAETRSGKCRRLFGSFQDISDRKRAEINLEKAYAAVKGTNAKYEELFSELPAMICVLRGGNHVFQLTNPTFNRITGNRAVFGKPIREALPEAAELGLFEALDEVFATGKPASIYEVPLDIRSAGNEGPLYLNLVGLPDRNTDRLVQGVYLFGVDVTDLVLARKKVEAVNEERKDILESITDIFFTIDRDWRISFWNKPAETLFRDADTDAIGRELALVLRVSLGERLEEELRQIEGQPEARSFEYQCPELNRWYAGSIFPRRDGFSISLKDVTQEKLNAMETQRVRDNLETVINSTDDLIWAVDSTGAIITANRSFQEHLAKIAGVEIKQEEPVDVGAISPSVLERWKAYYQRAFKGERFTIQESQNYDGEDFHSLVTFNPMYSENNTFRGVVCYSKDITERSRHLFAIEEQNRQLKDIAWLQSHGVRAPLARIMGLAYLMQQHDQVDDEMQDLVAKLYKSSLELDEVIITVSNKTSMIDIGNGI